MNEQSPSALAHKVIVVILYRLGFCFYLLKEEKEKRGGRVGRKGTHKRLDLARLLCSSLG